MSEKGSRLLISILLVISCILLILVFIFTEMNNQDKLQNPEVTPTITATASPTPTPQSTKRPTTIIIVTMAPTATPTAMPTATPTVEPTATPTIEPTAEPTATPTAEPTSTPTATPTAEPTATPTATPTVEPTATPTIEPTAEPTATPIAEPTDNKVEKIRKELSKLTMDGGIYIDYDMKSKHDLYDSINVVGISDDALFSELKKPFLDGIANWTNMQFVENSSSIDALSEALNSSICPICDRVEIHENAGNFQSILKLFEQIVYEGEYKSANEILLDYLYEHTAMNPNNPSERLILTCDCE